MPNTPNTRLIDADLLDALSVPARQGDYPRQSRAFVRIDTSLRVYWHTLFDICPELLTLSGPDGLAIFRPFMAWAHAQNLSLNWTYYLWVDVWLRQSPFREQVSDTLRYTLMGASAARWATGDRSESVGVVLGCSTLPDWIVAWKTEHLDGGRHIEQIELEQAPAAPQTPFGYFLLSERHLESEFPGWQALPR
ncbi:methanobactin biosynthesis protein MbnC [Alcaligenes faecalis]|uniref:methanobactin biosynthesis protein MbnC n=1 Tax=Alcaligenes faecalis TaxID=511 RepID=UPI000F0B7C0F|nr:methanobactin biosynthesis protein MbnC [Alcaligenes faecalis]AYR19486.1 methanobactin biosynthesis cassette protein MbnC [Alcaligenes faecalis]